jgi:hypothetical protein
MLSWFYRQCPYTVRSGFDPPQENIMPLHNDIIRDACYSASELQEMTGRSDLPSTLAPFMIPVGINPPAQKRRVGRHGRKNENAHRHPINTIDRRLMQRAASRVQHELYEEAFQNPEDTLIALIDHAYSRKV